VGFGVYFLERWPAETAIRGIHEVINRLDATAERTDKSVTWHSGPELTPEWMWPDYPDGHYNLGVAHGVPGIIHFLGAVLAAGIEVDRVRPLLAGAVEWVIAQQRPPGSRSWFSSWVPGESDSRPTWCYGDMGILAVLLQVARITGRDDWREFAQGLLEHCLAWPPDLARINDAPLCHGTAGTAHIFNRIYQSEGDPRCRDAAIAWFERTLAMRRPEGGVGGFATYGVPDKSGPPVWEPSPAFLDGAIGVALALLGAVSDVEPSWDRLLLLSRRSWS